MQPGPIMVILLRFSAWVFMYFKEILKKDFMTYTECTQYVESWQITLTLTFYCHQKVSYIHYQSAYIHDSWTKWSRSTGQDVQLNKANKLQLETARGNFEVHSIFLYIKLHQLKHWIFNLPLQQKVEKVFSN